MAKINGNTGNIGRTAGLTDTMTSQEFKRWQKRMGWSVSRTAHELRLNERQIYIYRSGEGVIPPPMERLCQLLEAAHQFQRVYPPAQDEAPKPKRKSKQL